MVKRILQIKVTDFEMGQDFLDGPNLILGVLKSGDTFPAREGLRDKTEEERGVIGDIGRTRTHRCWY